MGGIREGLRFVQGNLFRVELSNIMLRDRGLPVSHMVKSGKCGWGFVFVSLSRCSVILSICGPIRFEPVSADQL